MSWVAYAMIAWFAFSGVASVASAATDQGKYKYPGAVAACSLVLTLLLIWGTVALAT